MGQVILLTDLDDTLFTTRSKLDGHAGVQVTTARNGKHSFMTRPQAALFNLMRAAGEVVPVTARSSEAFARVELDFGTRRAILANGAVILGEDGEPDREWLSHAASIGRAAERQMSEMRGVIEEEFGSAVRSWVVTEYEAPVYLCAKMNLEDPTEVAAGLTEMGAILMERFDLSGFQHHVNGNNLSLTPNGVSKRAACEHLISGLGDRSEISLYGAGDSLTDLPFMGLCDVMMVPKSSQIAGRLMPREVRGAEDA
jgi:hydroxymethylpyrimidine pyrophosphatase-like HAD family hydrolase